MIVVIFDTIEPYVYEAFPIMFMPSGSIYEARFQLHHIDKELKQSIQENEFRQSLIGKDIILCVRSKYRDNLSGDTYDIFLEKKNLLLVTPIRYARLHSVHVISGVVLIRYALAQPYEYFDGTTDYEHYEHVKMKRNSFCQLLYEAFGGSYMESSVSERELPHVFIMKGLETNAKFIEHFTVESDEINDDVDPFSKNWRGVVSLFSRLPHLYSIPFIKYCGLRRVHKSYTLRDPRNSSPYGILMWLSGKWTDLWLDKKESFKIRNQVTLSSGTTYELKIFEVFPYQLVSRAYRSTIRKPSDEDYLLSRKYELLLDGNFFSNSSVQRAIGGYDFLEFTVPVKPQTEGYVGNMQIKFEDAIQRNRNFISTQLNLEYRIRTSWRIWNLVWGSAALTFLALATKFGWGEDIVRFFSPSGTEPGRSYASAVVALGGQIVYLAGVVGVVSFWVTGRR